MDSLVDYKFLIFISQLKFGKFALVDIFKMYLENYKG